MVLTVEDVVTHYVLSSHPKNKAIVDIKDKNSGNIKYIKIRHRLPKFYAVSLVDPLTFEVQAETQVKSASSKLKTIILHCPTTEQQQQQDISVDLRDTSKLGFEWCFTWEGERYKWIRESRVSNSLECRAIRKTGSICVAQYLPRMLKDEYFGIISLFGYNMLRCELTKAVELELLILMSLMTLLDKSNDTSWKRDLISKGVLQEERNLAAVNDNMTYDETIGTKEQQRKYRSELLNDQKLQLMLEKEARRSQKQIQTDIILKHNYTKISLSADNSPTHTPKCSPLPTPSSSSNRSSMQLKHQKSLSAMKSYRISLEEDRQQRSRSSSESVTAAAPPSSAEITNINSNSGLSAIGSSKLARFFSNLSNRSQQQRNKPSAPTSASSSLISISAPLESPTTAASASASFELLQQEDNKDAQVIRNRKSGNDNDVNKQRTMNNKATRSSTSTNFDIRLSQDQTLIKNQRHRFTRRKGEESLEEIPMVAEAPNLFDRHHHYPQQHQRYMDYYHHQNHHLSLPTNISLITDEFGRMSVNQYSNQQQQPSSLRSIRWNTNTDDSAASFSNEAQAHHHQLLQIDPNQSLLQQQQQHRCNQSQRSRLLRNMKEQRRISMTEYPTYATVYDTTPFVEYTTDDDYYRYYSPSRRPQQQYEYWS